MKLLQLSIAAAVSGLFLSAGAVAYAISNPSYTYVFTANPDVQFTAFDGSTITISDDNIIAWNLGDTWNGLFYSYGSGDGSQVLFENVVSADGNTWAGSFWIGLPESGPNFIGSNDGTVGANGGFLADDYCDPDGNWAATDPPAPDALNSLQLLTLALAGLGACHYLLRIRPVHGRISTGAPSGGTR